MRQNYGCVVHIYDITDDYGEEVEEGQNTTKKRATATLGAINGKLINVLICDEEVGYELLNS